MEARSITYSEVFRLPRFIPLRSQRNPLKEKYFCQVTCQTPRPLTATTHSKSVWTANLFVSVLVVPCYALFLWVLQSSHGSQVRKTTMPTSFTHLFHVPARSPVWWQTVFSLSASPNQFKPSFQFCHVTAQWTTPLMVSPKLTPTWLYWSLQCYKETLGTLWNPDIGSVKDMGEKVRQYWTTQLNAGFVIVSLRLNPQWIQWI